MIAVWKFPKPTDLNDWWRLFRWTFGWQNHCHSHVN